MDALVERGDEVVVVDDLSSGKREHLNGAASFVEADIRDGIDAGGAEIVFHLAAQADVQTSLKRPVFDSSVNVVGTVQVLEAARGAEAKLVFSSTGGAIYGECDVPASEGSAREPMSPYGIAKLCAEEYLAGWNRIYGSNHVVLRFANVYGPRQDSTLEGGVVAIFLERMASGEPTVIFGDGLQTRDFVYVDDVVEALIAAVEVDGGIFNIGTGKETTVRELHASCAGVAGVEDAPRFEPARPGDLRRSVLDVSHAAQALGWRARSSLDDGLAHTWEWLANA